MEKYSANKKYLSLLLFLGSYFFIFCIECTLALLYNLLSAETQEVLRVARGQRGEVRRLGRGHSRCKVCKQF